MKEDETCLRAFLKQHQNLKVISSHHVQIPSPTVGHTRFTSALNLRLPIERVRSIYAFERRQQSDTPGAINAKKLMVANSDRWRIEPSTGTTLRNYQTRYCVGGPQNLKRNLTDHQLTQAIPCIQDTPPSRPTTISKKSRKIVN